MKTKKLTFKKGYDFAMEARFVHKGEQYLWGIDDSGYNHVFIFNSEGCKPVSNSVYQQLIKELGLY
jgi:hypothetical protein